MLSKNKIAKPHLPPLRRKKKFLVTLEARGVGKGPAGSTEPALEHVREGGRSQSVSSLLLPCLPPKRLEFCHHLLSQPPLQPRVVCDQYLKDETWRKVWRGNPGILLLSWQQAWKDSYYCHFLKWRTWQEYWQPSFDHEETKPTAMGTQHGGGGARGARCSQMQFLIRPSRAYMHVFPHQPILLWRKLGTATSTWREGGGLYFLLGYFMELQKNFLSMFTYYFYLK